MKPTIAAILVLLAAAAAHAAIISTNGACLAAWPTRLVLADRVISPATPADCIAHGYRETTADEDAAEAAQQAAAAQQAQAAQLSALAQQIGPIVSRIRARLVELGHDLLGNSTAIMADVVARSEAGVLTVDQRTAQLLLTDMFLILRGQGITDDQINAVWEVIQ